MLKQTLIAALALAAAVALPGASNSESPSDAHFESMSPGGYKAVKVPDWVYDVTRMGFLTWRELSPEAIDDAYAQGIRVLQIHPKDLGKPGWLKRAKELKMRIVAAYGLYPSEILKERPEWRVQPKEVPPGGEFDTSMESCLLSPFGDYLIDFWVKTLQQYPIDGVGFDGWMMRGICHCPACIANYREATGKAIPIKEDLTDPEYKRYLKWQLKSFDDFNRRFQSAIKSVSPEIVSMTWVYNGGRYWYMLWQPPRIALETQRLFDMPLLEWWHDESCLGASITTDFGAAQMRAIAGGRPQSIEPYPSLHNQDWAGCLGGSFPMAEEIYRVCQAMTYGSLPCYAPFRHLDRLKPIMKELESRERWILRADTVKYAALLESENSRVYYGLADPYDRYLAHALGAFRAAIEEHMPLDVITDLEITEDQLSGYKVLILPNAACLSDRQCEVVRRFVRNGGGVVASGLTSAFDEDGDARENLALADVLGVSLSGGPSTDPGQDKDALVSFTDAALSRSEDLRSTVTHDTIKGVLARGRLSAVKPQGSPTVWAELADFGKPDEKSPAVVSNSFGKGRSVFFATDLDRAYFKYPYPYQREALKMAIETAAGGPPPFEVKAPMSVRTTFFTQKGSDGARLVIHLLNATSSAAMNGDPKGAVSSREEILPVHDVSVTIRGYDIDRIHLEPQGKDLRVRRTSDGVQVRVPRLDIHSMLVCEPAKR